MTVIKSWVYYTLGQIMSSNSTRIAGYINIRPLYSLANQNVKTLQQISSTPKGRPYS